MRSISRTLNRAFLCVAAASSIGLVVAGSPRLAYAQNPLMLGHPEDYPRVDIEHVDYLSCSPQPFRPTRLNNVSIFPVLSANESSFTPTASSIVRCRLAIGCGSAYVI